MKGRTLSRGFTLVEMLLVIVIIVILAVIVILAINPNKQLGDARNAQRRSDVNAILKGVYQFSVDNNSSYPTASFPSASSSIKIATDAKEICASGVSVADCEFASLVVMSQLTDNNTYIGSMPVDPQATTTNGTGYYISKTAENLVTINALGAENGAIINVTR